MSTREREFFIDNLLVRIHLIMSQMFWWIGLAPWQFEFPFPCSSISTFLLEISPSTRLITRGHKSAYYKTRRFIKVPRDLFLSGVLVETPWYSEERFSHVSGTKRMEEWQHLTVLVHIPLRWATKGPSNPNQKPMMEDLSTFGDTYPQNGLRYEEMAARTR